MFIKCPKCKKPFEYSWENGVILRECDCKSVSPPMNKIPIMQLFRLCIGSGTIPYMETPEVCCEKINCWYKKNNTWKTGFFHGWSQSYEEFENGPGNFPVAIIEDATDSRVHVVYAGHVSFNPDRPDSPNAALVKAAEKYKPTLDKEAIDFANSLPSTLNTQEITAQSSDAEVEAAYQKMVQREGGDHSQGDECWNCQPYDPHFIDPRFDPRPANQSHRFRPCLVNIQDGWWAVQVHPEAIELFSSNGVYQCQVRWIDGEVQASRGGLPVDQLREIFQR